MATTNGIMAPVENGTVTDSITGESTKASGKKNGNTLDKEAFLQLLVAQMKYQDPLEPTSNTEYISQLATFSSLEEMQNLNTTMTDMQGTNLVGKQVVMKITSEVTGLTTQVTGFVECVTRENGKTYLVIEGTPYNIEDLESVVDDAYVDAIALAETFKEAVANLPSVKDVTLEDKEKIEAAKEAVNAMSGYQQGFLDADSLTKLKELLARIAELEAAQEKKEEAETTETTDNSGGEKNE